MKHHSPALTTIPEDEELEEDLKIIRPLNEVKNDNINYHQIIRDHFKKPEYLPKPKKEKITKIFLKKQEKETAPTKTLFKAEKFLDTLKKDEDSKKQQIIVP